MSDRESPNPAGIVAERHPSDSSALFRLYDLCHLMLENFLDSLLVFFTGKSKLQRLVGFILFPCKQPNPSARFSSSLGLPTKPAPILAWNDASGCEYTS